MTQNKCVTVVAESEDGSRQEYTLTLTVVEFDLFRKLLFFLSAYDIVKKEALFTLDENQQNVYTHTQIKD